MGLFNSLFGSRESEALDWPELPTSGFVSGRVAVERDMETGDAVFLALVNGKPIGVPAAIQIPQYAYLHGDRGKRTPVIVVQAEDTPQGTMVGMRDARGEEYVATQPEVELLGTSHP